MPFFLNGVTGAGFALFLNHKRQKERPNPADFLITTPRSSSKSTCCKMLWGFRDLHEG